MSESVRASVTPLRTHAAGSLDLELERLYERGGLPRGASTGWPGLDKHYTVLGGQSTLITGVPGMGKSEVLDAIAVNLAERGWTFSLYSPENFPIAAHAVKLIEKRVRKPFSTGRMERLTADELIEAEKWLHERFSWISQPEHSPIEILSTALAYGRRPDTPHGVVIDPWNALDHYDAQYRLPGMSETDYISRTLSAMNRVMRDQGNSNVHLWIVAHPSKLYRGSDGKYPVPTGYDIAGSANWFNKMDNILCVHREKNVDTQDVDIYVQKVRFKNVGKLGIATLKYDRITGRYFEFNGPALHDITGRPELYADPEARYRPRFESEEDAERAAIQDEEPS